MDEDVRPWGRYAVLDEDADYKVKRIEVLRGKRLSYQKHASRAEHWAVVRGRAEVTLNGVSHLLSPGDSIDVPVGAAHRIANAGDEILVFIEVQRGSYLGEDDIVRLDDDYGRASG